MKKLISLFCVLALMIGIAAVGAVSTSAAVDSAKTMIDVKKGQTVTYRLKLGEVESKVIGSDFSIYYDPAVLTVDSVLDFNDNDQEEWAGNWIANPNISGEVLCNFSIISGVKFDQTRSFMTVNFTAKADATTDITYFVRFLYDYKIFIDELQKSKPQITNFKFTCDVSVDGETVLEDAQPQLNVDEPQDHGVFINTVTGDSNDADPETPGAVVDKDKAVAARDAYDSVAYSAEEEQVMLYGDEVSGDGDNGSGGNQNSGSNQNGGSGGAVGSVQGGNNNADSDVTAAPPATTADGYYITATDSDGNVTATSDEAPVVKTTGTNSGKGGSSPVIWIVIALVVLAGCGAGAYFYMKKKKQPAEASAAEASSDKETAPADKETAPAEKDTAPAEKDTAPAEKDTASDDKE